MIPRPLHRGSRRAFTLIESMATVVVLGTLAGIASLLIFNSVDGYTEAATAAQLHVETSIALDRAMREIRKIELDGSASGIAPNITDINAAGDSLDWTDSASASYTLTKSGSDLLLEVAGGGTAVLLTDVTVFSVQAYDETNTLLGNPLNGAACDDIRRITVNVTVSRNGVTHSLRSKVFLRSTMSGGAS